MEFDCGMFDRNRPLRPELGRYCTDEVASHSNSGIGVDPQIRLNRFGGEVQVEPADSEEGLHRRILTILEENLATDDLQYTGSIHVHIRVPALLEDVPRLRELIKWTTMVWPAFIEHIWKFDDQDKTDYDEWLEDCNRQVKTMTYDESALNRASQAPSDPAEIARALHNWPKTWDDWKNEWHVETNKVKRPAVNFGHIAINETIEFRSFTTTTDPKLLRNIIDFPRRFITMFLTQDPDPLKIVRGVEFQDKYEFPYKEHCGFTSRYFHCESRQASHIARLLIQKKITLADLNYPQFWIDKGFQ